MSFPYPLQKAVKRAMIEVSRSRDLQRPIIKPSIPKIKERWKLFKSNLWEFLLATTRTLILHDFYLFLIFMGVPVNRNPKYREMIDDLQRNYFAFERGDPDAKPIYLIKIPRGLMKSTIAMYFAEWVYLRKAILFNESTHALIGHGNDKKCADNIRLLSLLSHDERLIYMYQKYLVLTMDNDLNVSYDLKWATIPRREVVFSTVTPNKDPAGTHMNLAVIDDWATYENTKTSEAAQDNARKFLSLFSLDDHSKGGALSFFILYVCTPYAEDCVTETLVKKDFVESFEAPCCTQLFDPEHTQEEDLLWPEILSLRKLRLYYDAAVDTDLKWFRSQYDLVPYSRGGGLNFEGEMPRYSHDVCKSDDRAFCVVTADPKISTKNKKGQAVILVHVITRDGHIHTVDGWAEIGMRPSRHANLILDFAEKYKADMAIVEAVHYQMALKDGVEEKMEEREYRFQVKPHVHRQNKQEHYKAFLEPKLAAGIWHVNPILAELLRQIRGNSSMEDQIDCTSFLSEINIKSYASVMSSKKESNTDPYEEYLQNRRHSHIIKKSKDNNTCYEEIGW